MISHASSLRPIGKTPRDIFAQALRAQIAAIENGSFRYRIPKMRGLFERHSGMQYHFNPELFVQLGGTTAFSFPDEHFSLRAGEVCVVPKGMPHRELSSNDSTRFENLVVSFYNEKIDMHVAHEAAPGLPRADEVHFYSTDLYADLIGYLDRATELYHRDASCNATAIKALLLAEFSLLLSTVETPTAHPIATNDPIALCLWLVQHNLQESDLSLESLAGEIGCTPNYLSKLFKRRVGVRIVEYINKLRLQNAMEMLRGSRLSIKAIAVASGFNDGNYFCRLFRQMTKQTPLEFRQGTARPSEPATPFGLPPRLAHNVGEDVTVGGDAVTHGYACLPASSANRARDRGCP